MCICIHSTEARWDVRTCAREAECEKQCRNADDGQITVIVNICPLLLLFAMTTGQHAFYILVQVYVAPNFPKRVLWYFAGFSGGKVHWSMSAGVCVFACGTCVYVHVVCVCVCMWYLCVCVCVWYVCVCACVYMYVCQTLHNRQECMVVGWPDNHTWCVCVITILIAYRTMLPLHTYKFVI